MAERLRRWWLASRECCEVSEGGWLQAPKGIVGGLAGVVEGRFIISVLLVVLDQCSAVQRETQYPLMSPPQRVASRAR